MFWERGQRQMGFIGGISTGALILFRDQRWQLWLQTWTIRQQNIDFITSAIDAAFPACSTPLGLILPLEQVHEDITKVATHRATVIATHALNFLCDMLNVHLAEVAFTKQSRLLLCPQIKVGMVGIQGVSSWQCSLD